MTDNNKDTGDDLPPTEMIYYTHDGNFELECTAKILECQFVSNDESSTVETSEESSINRNRDVCVSLDRTVMYAQGGGQPTDIGKISLIGNDDNIVDATISVTKVLLDRTKGIASHMGSLSSSEMVDPTSLVGSSVKIRVDADRRQILSECHTAGHVVDMAMARSCRDSETDPAKLTMIPTKAYHFLEGPYVEYKGSLPSCFSSPQGRDELLKALQSSFRKLVDSDVPTLIQNIPRTEAEELCYGSSTDDYYHLKKFFKEDETVRIATVAGWPVPCGGTHVRSTGVLKARNWGVTGIRFKKGVLRVKYGQDWDAKQ